ncbi:MAG: thiol:disulfide interchange protein DsbA/DsbL [Pseudomonadota bacterium]|nr:thiol:disulfide interchange protein DsbA/DsbL [Pseudomonadota bacterium]
MKIVANTLTGILMLLIFSNATFAEERTQKYVQISNSRQADSEKIIIYEFFWYGCPHCYNIEPTIDKIESNLKEDTLLVRLPLALRDSWVNHAKAFFALEKMGKTSDLHEKIFEEIHINGNRLDSKSSLIDFIDEQGFSGSNFAKHFDSFGTEIRVNKAIRLANHYQIKSVPTIVVNGRYVTSGSFVTDYDELYNVVNLLVDKERADLN